MSGLTTSTTSTSAADPIEQRLLSGFHVLVALTLLVAFGFRLSLALGTFLNPDEALHYLLVNQRDSLAAYRASLTNAHPPLYFLFLYYWRFIGNSEWMLRLPSVLASTAASWMGFRWINLVAGRAAGLTALILLSFCPTLTALGAEVRDYSILLLWMAGALYFLERALRDGKQSSLVYSSVFLYLAILTHYSALWFTIAIGIYGLLRMSSLSGRSRLTWALFQFGGAALYGWLYVTHIAKIHGGPMEQEALTGWLRDFYFRGGSNPAWFVWSRTVDTFQFLFASRIGGYVVLAEFAAGVIWLLAQGLREKKYDRAAFGALLATPFLIAAIAALIGVYPYGGSRHSLYLMPFAVAGFSFLAGKLLQQRLLPILVVAVLVVPYWQRHRLADPQQMARKEQRIELMRDAMSYLRASVPPSEPVFGDYQSNILLAYYLGRESPPDPPRECGSAQEVTYGPYHVVVIGGWSATSAQFVAALNRWQTACTHASPGPVWVFDGGWGFNLVDDLNYYFPHATSHARHFGETISLFQFTPKP